MRLPRSEALRHGHWSGLVGGSSPTFLQVLMTNLMTRLTRRKIRRPVGVRIPLSPLRPKWIVRIQTHEMGVESRRLVGSDERWTRCDTRTTGLPDVPGGFPSAREASGLAGAFGRSSLALSARFGRILVRGYGEVVPARRSSNRAPREVEDSLHKIDPGSDRSSSSASAIEVSTSRRRWDEALDGMFCASIQRVRAQPQFSRRRIGMHPR